jgi:hypothetical protein
MITHRNEKGIGTDCADALGLPKARAGLLDELVEGPSNSPANSRSRRSTRRTRKRRAFFAAAMGESTKGMRKAVQVAMRSSCAKGSNCSRKTAGAVIRIALI